MTLLLREAWLASLAAAARRPDLHIRHYRGLVWGLWLRDNSG